MVNQRARSVRAAVAKKKPPKINLKRRTEKTSSETAGPIWVDGELYFSPLDLARFQLADHKLANTMQGLQLKKFELDAENTRHASEVRRLQLEAANLTAVMSAQREELTVLRATFQSSYPVDFNDITFDDETGKIMIHGRPVEEKNNG